MALGRSGTGCQSARSCGAVYARREKEIPEQADPFELDSGFFDMRSFVTQTTDHVAPKEVALLLSKALTGRSFMI